MTIDSFTLHTEQYEAIKELSDVQKGQLLDSLYQFALGKETECEDHVVQMAFRFILYRIKSDIQHKEEIKQKNKNNAAKRWGVIPFETEEKEDGEIINDSKAKNESIDYKKLLSYYNELAKDKLPLIQSMTEKRKSAVRARMHENGKDAILKVIQKAISSNFLIGHNDRNWHADFDWIFRPTNFQKILEGNYDNSTNAHDMNTGVILTEQRTYESNKRIWK
jgi:hypothetical protein